SPVVQLVAVGDAVAEVARGFSPAGGLTALVTADQADEFAAAGFELFAGRGRDGAYLCRDFVCRLPVTDPASLRELLTGP
ncbi:MAG: thioredoxin protein, partial [Microbacteriaceae bacterium]|nr:thioredoxin protein [Microbacteriaceae bacterium]